MPDATNADQFGQNQFGPNEFDPNEFGGDTFDPNDVPAELIGQDPSGSAAQSSRGGHGSPARKWIVSGAIAVGVAIGAAAIANAVGSDEPRTHAVGVTSTTHRTGSTPNGAIDPNGDQANGDQPGGDQPGGDQPGDQDRPGGPGFGPGFGPGGGQEITGPNASKVERAVTSKYPGSQIERVIQLTDGSYIVHTFLTDGNEIRVAVDKDFAVTGEQLGGPGGPGGRGFGRDGGPQTTSTTVSAS